MLYKINPTIRRCGRILESLRNQTINVNFTTLRWPCNFTSVWTFSSNVRQEIVVNYAKRLDPNYEVQLSYVMSYSWVKSHMGLFVVKL